MMELGQSMLQVIAVMMAGVALVIAGLAAVRIVPQSEEHVVERFGEYLRTLKRGCGSSCRSWTGCARGCRCSKIRSSRSM